MHIFVDADACPVAVRQILFRAAERTRTPVTLVANHALPVPKSPYVTFRQVERGFDVADHEIARQVGDGDLVITADIPLAAEVIAAGATALSPRGEEHTRANIGARLNMRDFLDTMRSSGFETGRTRALHKNDVNAFANALDRALARARKRK